MNRDIQSMINDYYAWLRDKNILKQVDNQWTEITTPFLDRHNDHIQIYLKKNDNGSIILTDDGYTIEDLEMSGCSFDNSEKRQKLLEVTLNSFGIKKEDNQLIVSANPSNFNFRKHSLIQGILAVDDMFYLASPHIKSLFFEDIKNWLDISEIRYIQNVNFEGKSGFNRRFDFAIPQSKQAPERIIKTINNPNKTSADNLVFSWIDTKETRGDNSVAYAIANDNEQKLSNEFKEALESYNINIIPASRKEEYREKLVV